MEKPDWVQPGAVVAIVSGGWRSTVVLDTITKVLARDVVLASGERFAGSKYSPDDIRQRGWSNGTYPAPRLRPVDHPEVLAVQEQQARDRAEGKVTGAYDMWRRNRTLTNAGELIRATEAWVALQPQEVTS
jgi:hypothetical protein